jgi:hypothetical protein
MAKQKSIFTIVGTIDGLTFYKTIDGYLVRKKIGHSRERIKKDPRFERTRENSEEFKVAAFAGKLLRNAIRPLLQSAADARVTSRLTGLMTRILKEDTFSYRGSRNPNTGINSVNGRAMLKSFNFNKNSILNSILKNPYTVNTTTNEIVINDFMPDRDVLLPEGATHIKLSGGILNIDFYTQEFDLKMTNTVTLPFISAAVPIVLTPAELPTGSGVQLIFLKIEFFQEVNLVYYPLKNGFYNALEIVEVGF